MTKEIELAAEELYPEAPYPSNEVYNTIQRSCQFGFQRGAQWMATRNPWNKYPDVKPTEYGHYEVFRAGADKQHYETWNNTGWAYNNRDITHWRNKVRPDGTVIR